MIAALPPQDASDNVHTEGRSTGFRRFNPYPEYKDSGIEWIGEIPAHWMVAPVHAQYEVALGKMLDAKRVTGESLGPYLRNVDVQWGSVNTADLPQMDFAPWERERYSVRPGDLLVCEGGEVGRTAMWHGEIPECFYQKALHRVRARTDRDEPRFLYYLMLMAAKRGVFAGSGNQNTIDHLTAVQLKHYQFPFAPAAEQRAIAAFLDRETARIDALVEKKQRLIELLGEQRAALITQAVTKGPDRHAPVTNSGIGWLGEIPMHWQMTAAGRLLERIEQGWSPVADDRQAAPDGWAVIKLSAVSHGTFRSEQHKALPVGIEANVAYEIRDGDFLMTRANTPDLVADVCIVRGARRRLMLCDLVYRLTWCSTQASPEFIAYWFLSTKGRHQIEVDARGASQSMVKVSKRLIRAWVIAQPPITEQRAIAAFLDRGTARIDALVAKINQAIERLKELRTALVSAAVTGKIDVREEAA